MYLHDFSTCIPLPQCVSDIIYFQTPGELPDPDTEAKRILEAAGVTTSCQ